MMLRQKIVDHMNRMEHVLGPHQNSSVDDYLAMSNMSNSGVWKTDIKIFAASYLFNVDEMSKLFQTMLDRLPVSSQIEIYLHNLTEVYYDVSERLSDSSTFATGED